MNEKWINKCETYVQSTLGLALHFSAAAEAQRWPLYLTQAYDIRRCQLLGAEFFALHVGDALAVPSAIAKHADWIRERTGMRSLFVFDRIAAYQRGRLIAAKIPFVCPGNQLYLPDLGLDLREYIKPTAEKVPSLSPVAQVLVLACLHRKIAPGQSFTGVELAARFNYTKMTMARALDELRQLECIETEGNRKSSQHRFALTQRELWEKARPHLRSPVTNRVYLEERFSPEKYKAGESALEELTLLGAPRRRTWAITSTQWKTLQQGPGTHLIPAVAKDNAHAELELWRYDPALLAEPPIVDALSLVLSFQDNPDERIQMAVDQVLRKFPW